MANEKEPFPGSEFQTPHSLQDAAPLSPSASPAHSAGHDAGGTRRSERRLIVISMLTRAVHDVAARMVYPFMPEIAAGLGISIAQMGALISLRNGVGLIAPVFGAMSDRIGHRRSAMLGLIILGAGQIVTGLAFELALAAVGFALAGIGSAIFVPTLVAYVSDRVPFARRGRVTGTIEMTWALAGMIGVPMVGLIITAAGWRLPFFILGLAAFGGAALMLLLPESSSAKPVNADLLNLRVLRRQRSALAFIGTWLLIFFAFENILVGYASWLEMQFGLNTAERGTAQSFFGIFEIVASASSALFLDRIGKKRGVLGGLIVATIGYALLAMQGSTALWLGLVSIGVAFLGFEFSVVSGVPIMGEQLPKARGTLIAFAVTAGSIGRMLGDLSGSVLLANVGFPAAALASAITAFITVVVFGRWVKESGPEG
jgi:predicted MFS family arabinose efflux permease